MSDEAPEPLILPFTDGLPVAPVHLDMAGNTQVLNAIVRPDLAVTQIAEQWRAALELSEGAALLVQLATSSDADMEKWGPCERVTPEVRFELNASIDEHTAIGGLLLGRDFLDALVTTFIGPLQRIAFIAPSAGE